MNKIGILGLILLPFNVIGLLLCVYSLHAEFNALYLLGVGLFVGQIVYIVKMVKVLEQLEVSKKNLESIARKAGLMLTKMVKGEKER